METFAHKCKTWAYSIPNPWKAAGITLVVMALTVWALGSQYQTNDDYFMSLAVSGGYGEKSGLLVYTNRILGSALTWLYTAVPCVSWYAWMQLALLFLAVTACVYLILETVPGKYRIGAALLFTGAAAMPAAMQVQYTVQAYYCILAGFALFAHAFSSAAGGTSPKKRTVMLSAAMVLCLLGFMVRDEAMVTIAPFFLFFGGYRFFWKRDKRPILWLLAAVCLGAGVMAVNADAYRSGEWQSYLAFNRARTELLDRPKLDYDANRAAFDAVGWNRTDYQVFYSWMMADEEQFTTEKISCIADHAVRPPVTAAGIAAAFITGMRDYRKFLLFCLLCLCLFLCLTSRKEKVLPLLVFGAVLCVHLGFIAIQRAPARIVSPHYVLGILLLLLMIDYSAFRSESLGRAKRTACGAAAIAGVLVVFLLNGLAAQTTYNATRDKYSCFVALDNYIAEHKDSVFLGSVYATAGAFRGYSIFDAPEQGKLENFSSLGGWQVKSPRYFAFKRRHKMENMFLSLTDKGVYLIDRQRPELIMDYLWENYGIRTRAEKIAGFEGVAVYKLHPEKPSRPGRQRLSRPEGFGKQGSRACSLARH